jgi:hypothetical protein
MMTQLKKLTNDGPFDPAGHAHLMGVIDHPDSEGEETSL